MKNFVTLRLHGYFLVGFIWNVQRRVLTDAEWIIKTILCLMYAIVWLRLAVDIASTSIPTLKLLQNVFDT